MKHQPIVTIGGEIMPCDFTPDGSAVVLDDVRIPWGRDSLYAPTNPSECHMTLLDPGGSWASDPGLFGAELTISTADLGVLFRGRVDGITITPDVISGDPNPDPPMTWTETRRNLTRSPRGTNLTRFAATLGTLATIDDDPERGILYTRSGAGASRNLEVRIGADMGVPGDVVTFRMEVMTPNSVTVVARPNTTSSTGSVSVTPNTIPALPGVWQTFECTVTLPAGWVSGVNAGFVVIGNAGAAGQEVRFRNFDTEHVPPPLGPFFYGDTADTDTRRYSWLATPDDSPSIQETGTGGGWPAPAPDRDVWRVEITASDVIAQLAQTVVPGYEFDEPIATIRDYFRSIYGPGYWAHTDTNTRLTEIERRITEQGLDTQIEMVDLATITPPGVEWPQYFREAIRRSGDDLYTMVQSVQMRSNEPIHSNYIPQTKVLGEGGFPTAAGLMLTYDGTVIDFAVDPTTGVAYIVDCAMVGIDGDGSVRSTVEQSISSLRLTQADYSTEPKTINGVNFTTSNWEDAQLDFNVPGGGHAQYEISPMVFGSWNVQWTGGVFVQSQRAADYAAQVGPIIAQVNGKLVPPPMVFDIENDDWEWLVPVIMRTYTPDDGAFTFPGSRYDDLIGWGPFFQMMGGELRFRQGWEVTIQFAPTTNTPGSGEVPLDELITIDPPTFDQFADRLTLSTLGIVWKGL